MARLYTATLKSDSPRYTKWRAILLDDEVPITKPRPEVANLGPESVPVYQVDIARLTHPQRQRLLEFVIEHFDVKRSEAMRELESVGFPIREADVSVNFNLRAFL